MDLGIRGRSALVCAASKGLGRACAISLAREGVDVTLVARGADALRATAEEIRRATGVKVTEVIADVVTAEGRAKALAACPQPDILVNNAGGPPAGDFRDFTREHWIAAVDANMLAPIELIKATLDAMVARKFGRIVNITSSAVKAPIDILALSNGARSGLTGFIAGIARKYAASNVTINNILPGMFDTETLRKRNEATAKVMGTTLEVAQDSRRKVIPAGRFGDPAEFGDLCAYVCSAQAAFITGQNLLIDGGTYPGTF